MTRARVERPVPPPTGAPRALVYLEEERVMGEHRVEVCQGFVDNDYDVECTCGFKVEGLSSREAADDTVMLHLGLGRWSEEAPDGR